MKQRKQILLISSLCIGLVTFVWTNYAAVVPQVAEDLAFSGTELGLIHAAFFAGYLVAVLPAGFVVDRFSAKYLVGIASTATGLFSVAFGLFTVGVMSGGFLRFLTGLSLACVYIPGMRLLSDWYPEEIRGRALGIYIASFSFGSGLALPLTETLTTVTDWRLALVATSLGGVLVGPIVLLFAADHPERKTVSFDLDLSVFQNREYLFAVGGYVGHNWELFAIHNWILAYLTVTPVITTQRASTTVAGLLAGFVVAIGAVGNVVGGWLSDYFGRIPVILTMMLAGGTLTMALGVYTMDSLTVIVVFLSVYGLILGADSTPLSTAITEIVSDGQTGTALAGQSFLGFIPGLISPLAFGIALDTGGYQFGFITAAVGSVIGLFSLWRLLAHRKENHIVQNTPASES